MRAVERRPAISATATIRAEAVWAGFWPRQRRGTGSRWGGGSDPKRRGGWGLERGGGWRGGWRRKSGVAVGIWMGSKARMARRWRMASITGLGSVVMERMLVLQHTDVAGATCIL